jgi:hypothetical protein
MLLGRQKNKSHRSASYAMAVCAALLPWSTAHAVETLFDISLGPRLDEMHWSRSGGPGGPNISTEAIWRSVDSIQLGFGFQAKTDAGYRLQTRATYGSIYDGTARETEYLGNNRSNASSRVEGETNNDDVYSISVSLGREFPITDTQSTTITPLVGFSYQEQNFRISDGFQVREPFGQAINVPDSTYRAEWWSTFIGLQLDYQGSRWDTYGRVEYHNADYEATGNWHLRGDFQHPVSFRHKSDGSGPIYAVGARYRINNNLAFNASFSWSNWDADSGVDRAYMSDGRVTSTDLNTVQWEHNALMLGVSYQSR